MVAKSNNTDLSLPPMSKLSLRFNDQTTEAAYLSATEPARKMQMRLALLSAGLLYFVAAILDLYIISEKMRDQAFMIHLAQGTLLCCSAYLLLHAKSQQLHTLIVAAAAFTAWNCHLFITMMGEEKLLFGEAYLMLIWVWLISGLSLVQAAKLNLLFICIFEVVVFTVPPFNSAEILAHQFFIFVSVVLGSLGAYVTEFYKRHSFVSLEKLSKQSSALLIGNEQLARDAATLMKLSQAVEQSGEAVLITDRHAHIEYVNPTFTKITGYLPDEIIGMTPAILKNHIQDPSLYRELWETVDHGQVWHGMLTDKKKDGSVYPAMISIAPIQDSHGKITHYVSTQTDMTKYQRLEVQLRHAQKMEAIGTLVGGIAHDFNNTLAGITGNIYLAKMEVGHLPDTLEILDSIDALAFRGADMIKQLLAFSRKGIVSMHPIDLSSFLNEVTKLHKVTLPADIELSHKQMVNQEMKVYGDINQLQQIIINLLNNARDAVAGIKDPKITVTLEKWLADSTFKAMHPAIQGHAFARISVIDNGCGIEEECLGHIFEPFYTTKGVNEGTGLGLSMAYGSAQSHGGIITVESEPGKGSSMQLYLPLLKSDLQHPVIKKTEELVARGTGTTVLVVDDDKMVLETIATVLKSLGYNVLLAADGLQAVETYQHHQRDIELVILDIVMPKMGGLEACKKIRGINPTAKVIFLTGYDPSQQLNSQGMASSEKVVMKPFQIAEFSQLLKSTLES